MAGRPDKTLETSLVVTTATAISTAIEHHWNVQYGRFVNYPPPASIKATHNLRPLPMATKKRSKGTWIASSSSMASLHILTHETLPEFILIVYFLGKVYEEHFISKLHFSWPQMSCLADCPMRGSRVVFASYIDSKGQVQKFALRFSKSNDSQTFISCLKESLKGASHFGFANKKFRSEALCPSQFMPSHGDGVHYSVDEELNYVKPHKGNTLPHQSALNKDGLQETCSGDATLLYDLKGEYATLPPSFTTLLVDCCTEAEQEQPKVPKEVDLKSHIVRYMTNSSFNDMLSKLDCVIEEMGGDLWLKR